jgi:hypothetical protein
MWDVAPQTTEINAIIIYIIITAQIVVVKHFTVNLCISLCRSMYIQDSDFIIFL